MQLYDGLSNICPICQGKIIHPHTGEVTMEQLEENCSLCVWVEVTDEGRGCLGYTPYCRSKWKGEQTK